MKIIKKIFGFLTLLFIIGGWLVFTFTYIRNRALLEVLVANSIVKGSMQVLKIMAYSVLAVIIGLIFFVIYLKIGSYVRKAEREKEEALWEQQRANEEMNRQLRKEAEEAKKEAEQIRKDNEMMKMTYMAKEEEKGEEQA